MSYDDEDEAPYEVEAATDEAQKAQEPLLLELPPSYFRDAFEFVVSHALEKQFGKQVNDVVAKRIDELLAVMKGDYLAKMVEDRLNEFFDKRFPKTNSWGEAQGQATLSLREHLEEKFQKYMEQQVSAEGKVESYGKQMKRSDWFIQKFGVDKLSEVAQGEIKKVRQEAEKQIAAAVGTFIAQNLVAPITANMISKT